MGMVEDETEISPFRALLFILGIIFIVVSFTVVFGSFYTIDAGQRGVLLTWGEASPVASQPGLHFKTPIAQSVVKMDVQTQKYVVDKATAASKDLQTVTTDVTVNYNINPQTVPTIYTDVGVNYQDKIIAPAIQEVVKSVTAQYTAEELITKRPEIKDKIDTSLTERMKSWNINIQSVAITNFDFSAEFNKAIESKVTAEQNALAAKNKLAQVEYEAQQRVTQAKGEAEAIAIQAQSISINGGELYVQLKAIEKWNGNLPTIMGGSAVPFINIGSYNQS